MTEVIAEYGTIIQGIARGERTERVVNLSITDLQRMERQLIPLLNTVRLMQGKDPVIVPGERETRVNGR